MHSTFKVSLEGESVFLRIRNDQYARKRIWDTNRHCHPEYELHIILEGSCRVDVEDRCYSLPEKSAILIAPGQYHSPVSLEKDFARFTLAFSTSAGKLEQALRERLSSCAVFPVSAQLCRICNDVFYESAAGNSYRRELQRSLVTQLIVYVLRLLGLSQKIKEEPDRLSGIERVSYIDDYFEHHFADKAGEEKLAQQLHMSKRQLARVLQKHYGMGFQDKLMRSRMDYATWLLRTTKKRIGLIAEEVGYGSESAFYQAFRRYFGVTPREYRAQNLNR